MDTITPVHVPKNTATANLDIDQFADQRPSALPPKQQHNFKVSPIGLSLVLLLLVILSLAALVYFPK